LIIFTNYFELKILNKFIDMTGVNRIIFISNMNAPISLTMSDIFKTFQKLLNLQFIHSQFLMNTLSIAINFILNQWLYEIIVVKIMM